MEILRSTGVKIGVYTGKIVAIVSGIGVTLIILRPVRQALFARFHARSRNIYREEVDKKKGAIFEQIRALPHVEHVPLNIVEIGTGIVENARLYPTNADITCVTTNVYRSKELRRLALEHPYIEVVRASPEAMTALENGSADVVVSVLGLCTAPQVEKALNEIKRILKKGGRYYFLEHTAAKKLSLTSRLQKRYRLWWGMLFYGCNIDRNLSKTLKSAGFQTLEMDKFTADVDIGAERYLGTRLNGFVNRGLVYMVGPHLIGMATM